MPRCGSLVARYGTIIDGVIIGVDASRSSGEIRTGTERYSREVTSALLLAGARHRFRLYVRDAPLLTGREAWGEGHVEIVPVRPRRLWTHLGLGLEIARRPPDALFVPAHVLPVSQAWRRIPRSVVTIHDVGYRHFPSAHPWRQRLYLDWSTAFAGRYASALVADSEATRLDLQRVYRIPDDRIRVAYPGLTPVPEVDETSRRATLRRFDIQEGTVYAIYVGTLQPRKNLRRLLRAWSTVIDRVQDSDKGDGLSASPLLVVAGAMGWGGEDLLGDVRELGLEASVRFTGYISDEEKAALMRGARALVFPSLYEGFGLPVLEAQSVGVPVVCSNTSSLPEVAGNAALLVNPFDVADIARAIRVAMRDEGTRAELIRAGARNVARFSWEACARIVLDLLEGNQALQGPAAPSKA